MAWLAAQKFPCSVFSPYLAIWMPFTFDFGIQLHQQLRAALRSRLSQRVLFQKEIDPQISLGDCRLVEYGEPADACCNPRGRQ
jgi:hypothetical protein